MSQHPALRFWTYYSSIQISSTSRFGTTTANPRSVAQCVSSVLLQLCSSCWSMVPAQKTLTAMAAPLLRSPGNLQRSLGCIGCSHLTLEHQLISWNLAPGWDSSARRFLLSPFHLWQMSIVPWRCGARRLQSCSMHTPRSSSRIEQSERVAGAALSVCGDTACFNQWSCGGAVPQ